MTTVLFWSSEYVKARTYCSDLTLILETNEYINLTLYCKELILAGSFYVMLPQLGMGTSMPVFPILLIRYTSEVLFLFLPEYSIRKKCSLPTHSPVSSSSPES